MCYRGPLVPSRYKDKLWACTTTILFVLCACETASYIEREKKIQAEIAREFDAEEDIWYLKEEGTGVCSRPHNEELRDVHCSPNIYPCALIREGVMGWACSPYG
jgi:hypothetical protein